MNLVAKARGATQVCQAPEDLQDLLERLGEMEPEVTLVMLDREASPASEDQRVTPGDLALAFLDREDPQERKVRRETAELVGAEETVGRRASLETRAALEKQGSQDQTENLVQEVHEEREAVMEILALREILASLNVT